jgi:hypothetical protein
MPARTSLGEIRTRRRSQRAAGPSASARRAASSQETGARAYQRLAARRVAGPAPRPLEKKGGLVEAVREAIDLVVWGRGDFYLCVSTGRACQAVVASGVAKNPRLVELQCLE